MSAPDAARDRLDAQQLVDQLLGRWDAVDIAQHARDRSEERPFIELGVIDLGGEGGEA